MDEAGIARAGLEPLAPLFAAIDAVKAPGDLPAALATLHRAGIPAGFSFAVRQDAKDSRRYLAADSSRAAWGSPIATTTSATTSARRRSARRIAPTCPRMFRLAGDAPDEADRLAAARDGPGDGARRRAHDARRAPRPGEDLQPAQRRAARAGSAGLRLAGLLRGGRRARPRGAERLPARRRRRRSPGSPPSAPRPTGGPTCAGTS